MKTAARAKFPFPRKELFMIPRKSTKKFPVLLIAEPGSAWECIYCITLSFAEHNHKVKTLKDLQEIVDQNL